MATRKHRTNDGGSLSIILALVVMALIVGAGLSARDWAEGGPRMKTFLTTEESRHE